MKPPQGSGNETFYSSGDNIPWFVPVVRRSADGGKDAPAAFRRRRGRLGDVPRHVPGDAGGGLLVRGPESGN